MKGELNVSRRVSFSFFFFCAQAWSSPTHLMELMANRSFRQFSEKAISSQNLPEALKEDVGGHWGHIQVPWQGHTHSLLALIMNREIKLQSPWLRALWPMRTALMAAKSPAMCCQSSRWDCKNSRTSWTEAAYGSTQRVARQFVKTY